MYFNSKNFIISDSTNIGVWRIKMWAEQISFVYCEVEGEKIVK